MSEVTRDELMGWLKTETVGRVFRKGDRHYGRTYFLPVFHESYVTTRARQHIYVKFNSVGIDESILNELLELDVRTVIVEFKDGDAVSFFVSKLTQWAVDGQTVINPVDGSRQAHLPLGAMIHI